MKSAINQDFLEPHSIEKVSPLINFCSFEYDFEKEQFHFDKKFGLMLGISSTPLLNKNEFFSLLGSGEQLHFEMFINAIKNDFSAVFRKDFKILTNDQNIIWVECSAKLVQKSDTGSAKKLVGIFQDISARKIEKRELSESERWFMEVLEESPHALYRTDYRTNQFDYVSKGFANALGMTRDEILGMPYTEFAQRVHPEDLIKISQDLEKLFAKNSGKRFTYYGEFRFKQKNGKYIWLDDTFTVIPGEDGQYSYQVGFGAVIEERKHLQEALKQAKENLEEKVKKRTTELERANQKLQAMMIQRQELEKKLLEISERERRFIGRELHDGLCQQIVGVTCMFEAIRSRLAAKKISEESEFIMMRDFLQDSVNQLRTLSRGLCPLSIEPGAVGAALETLASQTSVLYKIDCEFTGNTNLKINDLDTALHLFRISQEAIQNGIRHGNARKIFIDLTSDNKNICLTIENDGKTLGICEQPNRQKSKTEAGSGLGLKLIDYRVDLLGGTWEIGNKKENQGVKLLVKAPIREENIYE